MQIRPPGYNNSQPHGQRTPQRIPKVARQGLLDQPPCERDRPGQCTIVGGELRVLVVPHQADRGEEHEWIRNWAAQPDRQGEPWWCGAGHDAPVQRFPEGDPDVRSYLPEFEKLYREAVSSCWLMEANRLRLSGLKLAVMVLIIYNNVILIEATSVQFYLITN